MLCTPSAVRLATTSNGCCVRLPVWALRLFFLRLFLLASAAAKFKQYIFALKYSNEYQASCAQFAVV